MPLEIKELHIRVTVNQPMAEGQSDQGSDASVNSEDKDGIIQQCIEQVIDLMNSKNER